MHEIHGQCVIVRRARKFCWRRTSAPS